MKEYRICERCIMDTSDSGIEFDENGICNNCKDYEKVVKEKIIRGKEREQKFNEVIKDIKQAGKNKKYDCVIGVSGGVDSTYVAYLAKKSGLRPLAVHLDNGWDTKIAAKNIANIVKKLGIDLETYVIDWEEFKDMQLAYLKASVVDIEAITDHAIKATLFKIANKNGVKYILSGVNITTEGVLPRSWRHNKNDYKNIIDIHKKFGKVKLKTFPILKLFDRFLYQIIKGIKYLEILNYINYKKEKAKKIISKKLGWEDYGGKHRESMFTDFFQSYILPRKFNIDKRKVHLSALICAGQMTKEEALKELQKPLYDEEKLKKDKEYVLNKFGLMEEEFDNIMKVPAKSHYSYKSNDLLLRNLRKIYSSFIAGRK